jgi:AcrR family transcriptional regulator
MKARSARARVAETRSTRDVILDAAERRFAERGFAGVSVREIASDAGLKNQASLYHHFKNKKALYEAVLARGVAPILEMVASSNAPTDTGLTLEQLVDYLAGHPHLPRLIQRAGLDDTKLLRSTVTKLLSPLYVSGLSKLATSVAGGWEASEMPHLALGIYHLVFGYFANAALFEMVLPEDPRSPAAVARQAHFIKAAVTRLLGPADAQTSRLASR